MFDKLLNLIVGIGSALIGFVFLCLQIASYIGNIAAGVEIKFFPSFESWPIFLFDLFYIQYP